MDSIQTFKHLFTPPSSIEAENVFSYNMTSVTCASIAYAATQVRFNLILIHILILFYSNCLKARFALSSSSVFSRRNATTDSEHFYNSLVTMLLDPEESHEVNSLLNWWKWLVIFIGIYKHLTLNIASV